MLHIARTKPFSCAGVHTFSRVHPEHFHFLAAVFFAKAFAEASAGAIAEAAAGAGGAFPEAFTRAFPEVFAGAFTNADIACS